MAIVSNDFTVIGI